MHFPHKLCTEVFDGYSLESICMNYEMKCSNSHGMLM
jgi:hypothetical protein